MTNPVNYPSVTSLTAADLMYIYPPSTGDWRKCTLSTLTAYLTTALSPIDGKETQYAAPSSTGFTVTVAPVVTGAGVWLVLTPTAGFAAGTIALPAAASSVHKQEILINCTQAVTALTVTCSGGNVTGEPSALSANGYFRMRYDSVTSTWYRVG